MGGPNMLMQYAIPAGAVVGGLIILWVIAKALGGTKKVAAAAPESPLNVSLLDAEGPPPTGIQLTAHGTPVRIAVLVVAPAGRGQNQLDENLMNILVEELVPGIGQFISRDVPMTDMWPAQMSTQGFVNTFMSQIQLPDRGRGNRWSALAGRITAEEGGFLVGMALCAAKPTGLSEYTVEHDGQWSEILRVSS